MSTQTKFILKNVIRVITLLFAVSVITFALATMAPIDPVEAYAGSENHLPQEQLDQIAEKWGWAKPPIERYLSWIGGVLTGDWGVSVIYHRPVIEVVGERFLTSLALMGTAWILSGILGFVLGILCGLYQNSWADRLIKGFCLVLAAAPTFWLALLALMCFSVFLGWFPTGLAAPAGMRAEDVTLGRRLHHLFLPALVLSVTGIAQITLQTREKTIEEIGISMREFERIAVLSSVDRRWMDHIDAMDQLREGIGLRAYGQRDPIVEYKHEGYAMFEDMIRAIQEETTRRLYLFRVQQNEPLKREKVAKVTSTGAGGDGTVRREPIKKKIKVGRNDPCPCGSGKKYKNCCLDKDMAAGKNVQS